MNKLSHVFNLIFGLYGRKFDKEWSDYLIEVIENHDEVKAIEHAITFKLNKIEIEVWTSNKFYAYGHAYRLNDKLVEDNCQFRPSLKAMKKLYALELKLRKEADSKSKSDFIKSLNPNQ